MPDSLELEFKAVVSYPVWMLGIESVICKSTKHS